jgi:hypothetical protein
MCTKNHGANLAEEVNTFGQRDPKTLTFYLTHNYETHQRYTAEWHGHKIYLIFDEGIQPLVELSIDCLWCE